MIRWPVLSLLASGCLPFALPPSRVEVGGGAEASEARPVAVVRGSVHPLGMFRRTRERVVDAGMGYGLITRGLGENVHGPFVMAEYFAWRRELSGERAWRLGINGGGGLAFSHSRGQSQRGFDLTLGVDFEQAGFAEGAFSGNGLGAVGYGEWSFGAFAAVGTTRFSGLSLYSFVAGIQGRLPGALGLMCCATPRL